MTRSQHIKWCKERALEHVKNDELDLAWSSMTSDLNKHPETRNHIGIDLGTPLFRAGKLNTKEAMTKFINDFN